MRSPQEISSSMGPSRNAPRSMVAASMRATMSPLRGADIRSRCSSQPCHGFSTASSRSMARTLDWTFAACFSVRSARRCAMNLSLSVARRFSFRRGGAGRGGSTTPRPAMPGLLGLPTGRVHQRKVGRREDRDRPRPVRHGRRSRLRPTPSSAPTRRRSVRSPRRRSTRVGRWRWSVRDRRQQRRSVGQGVRAGFPRLQVGFLGKQPYGRATRHGDVRRMQNGSRSAANR